MIKIIGFIIIVIGTTFWMITKEQKAQDKHFKRTKETIKEAIKEAFKELDEEMYFNDDDDFDQQDEELNNLHKVVENDINDLEYTLRKELKENGK